MYDIYSTYNYTSLYKQTIHRLPTDIEMTARIRSGIILIKPCSVTISISIQNRVLMMGELDFCLKYSPEHPKDALWG